jgi:hypothetical protein
MCKVLISTGISHQTNALKFMRASKPFMSRADKDGIGYLATDSLGNMFSEKWHNNNDFLSNRLTDSVFKRIESMIDENIGGYASHGSIKHKDITSLALHTRFATCGREFNNTHPFIIDGVGLIHNGVIGNSRELINKISTCDSETILNQYLKFDVRNNPSNISQVTDTLQGYWALGIIGTTNDGIPYLDVVKNDTANLFVTSIKELGKDNITFCTTKDILIDTIKSCGFNNSAKIFKVKSNVLTRFNALTGEVIAVADATNGKVRETVATSSNRYLNYSFEDEVKYANVKSFHSKNKALSQIKYNDPPNLDEVGDDTLYESFEEFLLTEGDFDLQSVYYDLPFQQRKELEDIEFEQAISYLQEIADDFYVTQAKTKKR